MKLRLFIGLLLPIVLGGVAMWWTPFGIWNDMKEGLIAFLGFLAASLVQVMPITANFLQSDRLTLVEAKRLTDSLTRQQHYWVGLLSATIAAMVIVIVSSALKNHAPNVLFVTQIGAPTLGHICVFLIASSVSFVLIKMLGLFKGMMSLHHLRGELVINAAKRAEVEQAKNEPLQKTVAGPVVPHNYGQVIRPH